MQCYRIIYSYIKCKLVLSHLTYVKLRAYENGRASIHAQNYTNKDHIAMIVNSASLRISQSIFIIKLRCIKREIARFFLFIGLSLCGGFHFFPFQLIAFFGCIFLYCACFLKDTIVFNYHIKSIKS